MNLNFFFILCIYETLSYTDSFSRNPLFIILAYVVIIIYAKLVVNFKCH